MGETCFVIQPFDGGRYDKLYSELFEPAIRNAGFDPYRVDLDLSASIPIETIERQVEEAAVCFANISEDNPNVWFELGLAIAFRKEVCLVCKRDERGFRSTFSIDRSFNIQMMGPVTLRTSAPASVHA